MSQADGSKDLQNGIRVSPYLVTGVKGIGDSSHRMAFNYCRPLLLGDDPSVSLGRRFLQHPMSMATDARLVSSVELLSGRSESSQMLICLHAVYL